MQVLTVTISNRGRSSTSALQLQLLLFVSVTFLLFWYSNRQQSPEVAAAATNSNGETRKASALSIATPAPVAKSATAAEALKIGGLWYGCLEKGALENGDQQICGCSVPSSRPATDISSADGSRRLVSVPPNHTYKTLSRSSLVKDLVLSLNSSPDKKNEFELRLWKCNAETNTLGPMSSEGMSFVGFAESEQSPGSSIKTSLTITPSEFDNNITAQSHAVSFYDKSFAATHHFLGVGNNVSTYKFTIILAHLGGQSTQDPPCAQGLYKRDHCLGETLWMDSVTRWMQISDVQIHSNTSDDSDHNELLHPGNETEFFKNQPEAIELKALPICTDLESLTPGVWVNKSYWQPNHCRRPTTPPSKQRILLAGDSTFEYLSNTQSLVSHSKYIPIFLPFDIPSYLRTMKHPEYDALFFTMGLHSACYRASLEDDMDMLRPILKQLAATWGSKLIVRSTTNVAYIPGLDYNDKKCIYYTSDRLVQWNAWLREECQKLGIVYWDFHSMTSAIGPASTFGWASSDGIHYCKESGTSTVCQEEGKMIEMFTY